MVSTTRPLEILHMDLIGPVPVQSLEGCFYTLVVVDDFSRFTWTEFLKSKSVIHSSLFVNVFKINKIIQLSTSVRIMAKNLKILVLLSFVNNVVLLATFPLLIHLNQTGLLKGRIGRCKKWQILCLTSI